MAKQTFVTGQVLTAAQMTALQANDYNQTVSAKVASYVLVAADAGTRITMSNAGATTITVNTSLFTAGDTLFITNIGAGACTITAGTATVSTASSLVLAQYDSGRLYFTSTGVAIWEKYQGAVAGSSSGLTLITRQTFSNVAGTGTTFDGVFTSTYKTYFVDIEKIYGTYADDLQLQFRYAGPTTQAANYNTSAITATAGSATVTNNTAANATEAMLSIYSGLSASPQSAALYVNGVGNASETPSYQGTNFNQESDSITINGGRCYTARTYTGFLLKGASANIYGTVAVYGLAAA